MNPSPAGRTPRGSAGHRVRAILLSVFTWRCPEQGQRREQRAGRGGTRSPPAGTHDCDRAITSLVVVVKTEVPFVA